MGLSLGDVGLGLVSPAALAYKKRRAVGDFLGTSGPDTSGVQGEVAGVRSFRGGLEDEYRNPSQHNVAAGTVTPERVGDVTIDPIERASAAGPVTMQGATLGGPAMRSTSTVAGARLDTGLSDQSRAAGQTAVDSYKGVLDGSAPSVAQLQLRDTLNQNVNQQLAVLAGARGRSLASARRGAARNIGMLNQNAGAAGALLRAKELDAARGGLAASASDMRSADLSQAGKAADLTQGAQTFNATARNVSDAQSTDAINDFTKTRSTMDQDTAKTNAMLGDRAADRSTTVSTANAGAFNNRAGDQARLTAGLRTGDADRSLTGQTTNVGNQIRVDTGNVDRNIGLRENLRGDILNAYGVTLGGEQGLLAAQEAAKQRRLAFIRDLAKKSSEASGAMATGGMG